jgi:hypothetical protein
VAQLPHKVTSGIRSPSPLLIGARSGNTRHTFDGLIDDVRISTVALAQEQLLMTNERASEQTAGWWKFEVDPGVYRDSSSHANNIAAKIVQAPREDPRSSALVDFCHVLLNTNEFLYVD